MRLYARDSGLAVRSQMNFERNRKKLRLHSLSHGSHPRISIDKSNVQICGFMNNTLAIINKKSMIPDTR